MCALTECIIISKVLFKIVAVLKFFMTQLSHFLNIREFPENYFRQNVQKAVLISHCESILKLMLENHTNV